MTYEEYQAAIIVNIEAMRETRRQQSDEQKQLCLAIIAKQTDAKRRYMEELRAIEDIQREKAKAIADKWKAERTRLHLEHAKVIEQWRVENKITPPSISNCPQESGLTKEEQSYE